MTVDQLLPQIEALANPATARVLKNHGARDPVWGAKIGDMKALVKGVKNDPDLARGLFASGVYDAMYLAALVTRGDALSAATLDAWARLWYGGAISENTVPWLAVEHPDAPSLALGWIDSPDEAVRACGWATLGGLVAMVPDDQLPHDAVASWLERAAAERRSGFVVMVAVYGLPWRDRARALARGSVAKKTTMKC